MGEPAAVSCFSYLASVHTLHVQTFPAINYGVDVERSDRFLAGDGPLVAGFLTALGHPATLYANPIGDDPAGHAIRKHLDSWGVTHAPGAVPVSGTRTNTVVVDHTGNRTWFSGLRGIVGELDHLDLDALTAAPMVYLDCYEVLQEAPRRVLQAALEVGRDIVINLGGSPPPTWLRETIGGRTVSVLQTNADEHDPADAARTLDALSDLGIADLTVVTAGRRGAIGRTRNGRDLVASAVPVDIRQVQGAGSAFSAALIHSLLREDDPQEGLRFACAAGSLWCGRTHHGALPTSQEITTMTGP